MTDGGKCTSKAIPSAVTSTTPVFVSADATVAGMSCPRSCHCEEMVAEMGSPNRCSITEPRGAGLNSMPSIEHYGIALTGEHDAAPINAGHMPPIGRWLMCPAANDEVIQP